MNDQCQNENKAFKDYKHVTLTLLVGEEFNETEVGLSTNVAVDEPEVMEVLSFCLRLALFMLRKLLVLLSSSLLVDELISSKIVLEAARSTDTCR